MKFAILLDMLFDLLAESKLTAAYFAEKYALSNRTVYRYVEELKKYLPIHIQRGRNGGICLADNFKLPTGFLSKTEYDATIEALMHAYANSSEDRFLSAKRKLSAQEKKERTEYTLSIDAGNIVIDSRFGGDLRSLIIKLRILETCIREKRVLETQHRLPDGTCLQEKIEPHLLGIVDNVWKVYAFCHRKRAFAYFDVGNLYSLLKTETVFRKRPFKKEELYHSENLEPSVKVRLSVATSALPFVQAWLGVENLRQQKSVWIAEATLPDSLTTIEKIVSFGAGVKVLSPPILKARVLAFVSEIQKLYEP